MALIPIPVPEGFVPQEGDDIYVGTHLYLSHGEDDVVGGRAQVIRVEESQWGPRVEVLEHPGVVYAWKFLAEEQPKLAKDFGDSRAHPDPDYDPEFNRWD